MTGSSGLGDVTHGRPAVQRLPAPPPEAIVYPTPVTNPAASRVFLICIASVNSILLGYEFIMFLVIISTS